MEDFQIISTYTRKEAINDGVLKDVSETAKEAGFKIPVAVTLAVWMDISDIPLSQSHQCFDGRLWDVLSMLRFAIRNNGGKSEIRYRIIMHVGRRTHYSLKAICGPGDNAEPVITIMKPGED